MSSRTRYERANGKCEPNNRDREHNRRFVIALGLPLTARELAKPPGEANRDSCSQGCKNSNRDHLRRSWTERQGVSRLAHDGIVARPSAIIRTTQRLAATFGLALSVTACGGQGGAEVEGRPPHSGELPIPSLPLERPCPQRLADVCGGERLYLAETLNWPDPGVRLSILTTYDEPSVLCRSSEPSSCVAIRDEMELVGAAGIYRVRR